MMWMMLLFLLVYLTSNVWVFVQTLRWLDRLMGQGGMPLWGSVVLGLFFLLAAFALPLTLLLRESAVPDILMRALHYLGSIWLVWLVIMLVLLLVVPYPLALGLTTLVLVGGYLNFRHNAVHTVPIGPIGIVQTGEGNDKDEEQASGTRILLLSDVHLGYGTGKRALERHLDKIASLQPDLILIAGDLIDNSLKPVNHQQLDRLLARLSAPLGVYAVPGNHEYISGIEACEVFYAKTPITLLRDSVVVLDNGWQLIGRDDRSNRQRKPLSALMEQTCPDRPVILMDHQPYELARTDEAGVWLHVYGHTHNGQLWPLTLLIRRMYEQGHGYRKWPHSHAYVCSGTSLWGPPFRIGTRGEYVLLEVNNLQQVNNPQPKE